MLNGRDALRLPSNGWLPRPDQLPFWEYVVDNGGTRAVLVAHRRFGKDECAMQAASILSQRRVANYWHLNPEASQARKTIWTAVNPRSGKQRIDEIFPFEMRAATRNNEMMLVFRNGSTWQVAGSDNYPSLTGSGCAGITFSEFGEADPRAWPILSPMLEENSGYALFVGTPKGCNHFERIHVDAKTRPGWWTDNITALQTPVFSAKQLEDIKQQMMSYYKDMQTALAIFDQEYMGSFTGPTPGAYLTLQMRAARDEGRICQLYYDPRIEVYSFWDLGVDDSTAIWLMQPVGKQFHFLCYYEATGYGLEHYAKWLKEQPYNYGSHFMPHDAEVREMGSPGEIALSRREVAEGIGIKPIEVVPRAKDINVITQVHIPAMRDILGRCWFDDKKCSRGIAALEGYMSKWDDTTGLPGLRPARNSAIHGADSFRTFCTGWHAAEGGKDFVQVYNSLRHSFKGRW